MPVGLNKLEINKFFSEKSILHNFRFYVTIIDKSQYGMGDKEIISRTGPTPILDHHHVISITLPNYKFSKYQQNYGPLPRSFPYLEYDGLEIPITFEEDEYGRVGYFLNTLQKRIVDSNGLYSSPARMKLDKMIVQVENDKGIPVVIYTFNKIFLMSFDQTELNYGSNESVKYNAVFNADYYNVTYPIAIAGQASSIAKTISNI